MGLGRVKRKKEDSIRKTDTDLYNKTNLQTWFLRRNYYCAVCDALSIVTVALWKEGKRLSIDMKDHSEWKTRVKADLQS